MGEMGVCPVCRKPFAQAITEIPFMKKKSCTLTKEQKQRRQKILGITRKEKTPSLTANQVRNTTLQKLCPAMESEAVVSTRCGHVFHKVCLRDYCHTFRSLRKKGLVECPICKQRIVVTGATVLDLRALEGYSEVTEQKLKFAKVMNKELKDQYEPLLQKTESLKQNTSEEERILAELEKRTDSIRGQWAQKRNEYNDIIALIDEIKSLDDNETKLQMENRRLTTIYLAIITHEMSTCKPSQRVPKELYPYLKGIQKHPEVIDSFREVICPLPLVNRKTVPRHDLIKLIINTIKQSHSDRDKRQLPPVHSWEDVLQYPIDKQDAARRTQPSHRPVGPRLSSTLTLSSASSLDSLTTNDNKKSARSTPVQPRPTSPPTTEHADEECDWEPLLAYNRKKSRGPNNNPPTTFVGPKQSVSSKRKAVRFHLNKSESISPGNSKLLASKKLPNSSNSSEILSSDEPFHCKQVEKSPVLDSLESSGDEGVERQDSKDTTDTGEDEFRRVQVDLEMLSFPADTAALNSWRQRNNNSKQNCSNRLDVERYLLTTSEEAIETLRPVGKSCNKISLQPHPMAIEWENSHESQQQLVPKSISASAILIKPDVRYPKVLNQENFEASISRRLNQLTQHRSDSKSTKQPCIEQDFLKSLSKHTGVPMPLDQTSLCRIESRSNLHRRFSRSISKHRLERSSSKVKDQTCLEQRFSRIRTIPENDSNSSLGISIEELLEMNFEECLPGLPSLSGLDIPVNPKPTKNILFSRIQADTNELFNKLTTSMSATDLIRELEKDSLSATLIRIENRLTEYRGVRQRTSSVSILRPPEKFRAPEAHEIPEPNNSIRRTLELMERTLATLGNKNEVPVNSIRKPPSRRLRPITPTFRKLVLPAVTETDLRRPVWTRLPKIHPTSSLIDRRTPLEVAFRPESRSAPLPKYARIRRITPPAKPPERNAVTSISRLPPLPSTSSSGDLGENPQKKFKDIFSSPCIRVQASSRKLLKAPERPTNSGDCPPATRSRLNWNEVCNLLPPGKLGIFRESH